MKKTTIMTAVAVVLVVLGLVLGAFAISNFNSAKESAESLASNEARATEAEASGDLTEAAKYLDYATFDAKYMNDKKNAGTASAVGAILLILGGGIVFVKRQ